MTALSLLNSPGRGSSGKVRNFKAMSAEKLAGVIADLEEYGEDPEALAAACAAAGKTITAAPAKPAARKKATRTIADPIGLLPEKIPMKADDKFKTVTAAVGRHDSILEPKLDGHRVLVHRFDEGVKFYAGSGVDKTYLVPTLEAELLRLPVGTWLDGEAITGDGKGAESGDWGSVQSILGNRTEPSPIEDQLKFMVFDLLAYDGTPADRLRLDQRREILEGAITKLHSPWVTDLAYYDASQENYEWLLDEGFEGGVVKWLETTYLFGKRGAGWWKLKSVATEDVIVMGFKPGKGSFAGMIGAIVFGQVKDGRVVERGSCSGMDMTLRREITDSQRDWIGKVIEIAHMGTMAGSDQFRHPQFKRVRTDKQPKDCTWTN